MGTWTFSGLGRSAGSGRARELRPLSEALNVVRGRLRPHPASFRAPVGLRDDWSGTFADGRTARPVRLVGRVVRARGGRWARSHARRAKAGGGIARDDLEVSPMKEPPAPSLGVGRALLDDGRILSGPAGADHAVVPGGRCGPDVHRRWPAWATAGPRRRHRLAAGLRMWLLSPPSARGTAALSGRGRVGGSGADPGFGLGSAPHRRGRGPAWLAEGGGGEAPGRGGRGVTDGREGLGAGWRPRSPGVAAGPAHGVDAGHRRAGGARARAREERGARAPGRPRRGAGGRPGGWVITGSTRQAGALVGDSRGAWPR